jgi:sialidase-1
MLFLGVLTGKLASGLRAIGVSLSPMNPKLGIFALALILLAGTPTKSGAQSASPKPPAGLKKIKDLVIYQDEKFHSAFPSIVKRPDGELLIAFRRAPDRRLSGQPGVTHTDANSYLMLVRSKDGGETWSRTPELLYAHPFGGSQDPCVVQLKDSSLLCTSYGWAPFRPEVIQAMEGVSHSGNFVFLGGYILRSKDGGYTWQEPIIPPPTPGQNILDHFGQPVPAYNRGAMCESRNGTLYWVVAGVDVTTPGHASTHLMLSKDKGITWNYSCPVAHDKKVAFNESSLYETPKGDLVAFMRSEKFDDHTTIARSTDGGKSFNAWQDAGFQGHPHYALRLPDQRVLLVYGYRHAPFGIRARVLDAECTNFATAEEIILRDDGGNRDLGYPWATLLSKDRVLVVYYFNHGDGTRYIAGTLLSLK